MIDIGRLLAAGLAHRPRGAATPPVEMASPAAADGDSASEQIALISFDLGGQEFALPLDRVREIVALPETTVWSTATGETSTR